MSTFVFSQCNCKESQNKKLEERVFQLQLSYKSVVDELERSRSSCEDREEKYAELSEKVYTAHMHIHCTCMG